MFRGSYHKKSIQYVELGVVAEIILEPSRKILVQPRWPHAALAQTLDNFLFVLLPCDHYIDPEKAFFEAVKIGLERAQTGSLITLGVEPTRPETGYGYIETNGDRNLGYLKVNSFTENLAKNQAIKLISKGNYFWNSGVYVCDAKTFLNQFEVHQKSMFDAVSASIALCEVEGHLIKPNKVEWVKIVGDSIDYSLTEKLSAIECVPLNANWSDVGN